MPQFKWAFILFSVFFMLNTAIYSQIAAPTPPSSPVPADAPEKIDVEEIKLNILAFDAGNKFVGDLKAEDVAISEDGRLQPASSLRYIPANVLLLLDVGSEMTYAKRNKDTAETALGVVMALRAEDTFAALQYGDRVEVLLDWTQDRGRAAEILKDDKLGFGRRSAFIYAINKAIEFFNKTPRENRHLVVISDGVDSFNDKAAREAVTKRLLASDISVHVISYTRLQQEAVGVPKDFKMAKPGRINLPPGTEKPGENQPSRREDNQRLPLPTINLDRRMTDKRKADARALQTSEEYLTTIAEDTNGEMFLPGSIEEMLGKTGRLARNIDSQYVVTYAPKRPLSESANGETRVIEVLSRRSGVSVQGRRKFIVAKN